MKFNKGLSNVHMSIPRTSVSELIYNTIDKRYIRVGTWSTNGSKRDTFIEDVGQEFIQLTKEDELYDNKGVIDGK